MTKPKKSEFISKITKGIVPTTAIASGILSQPSWGAPGDLDPTFGDMGRASFSLRGAAFRVQELTAHESLLAGGEVHVHIVGCDFECANVDGFIGQISPTGSLDLEYAGALLGESEVFDFALQPDGKVVAVGQMISAQRLGLTVFRLIPGGLLDPNFADNGVMRYATDAVAQSVALDPSGAIVVAGSNGKLMVLRLLANGTLDGSFGNGGAYIGPPIDNTRIHIWRAGSGGYRVSATLSNLPQVGVSSCAVVALTATGVVDTTFGEAGIAALPPHQPGASTSCQAMTAQSDGSLLLGGQEGGHGFVKRLLASGALDPSFGAGAVQSNIPEATALAVDATGSILVAGAPNPGVSPALILRLHATGLLDELFGDHGLTWIDLASINATGPTLNDMRVLADGRVLAAGGEWSTTNGQQPLLVRLLGASGTAGPGVIGVSPASLSVKEEDKMAIVTVRRMGGATGDVSVAYRTADYEGTDAAQATSGADYTPVTGRLTWADGDRNDRQITVPIISGGGQVDEAERFTVTLYDAKGGAKIGTQDAVVEIAVVGDPPGELGFEASAIDVNEADGNVQVVVDRNYSSKGAVSVTLTPIAGSATTADFAAAPITLSWADGDSDSKTATIPIVKDNVVDSPESFTVELSNPTNGALIGPHSRVVVTIHDVPPSGGGHGGRGGGGAFDWFVLLCLGCVRWLRRRAFPQTAADNTN